MIFTYTSSPGSFPPSMTALDMKETLGEAVSVKGVNHIQVKHRDSACLAIIALVIFQRTGSYFILPIK
jgi:hypothetical protein